MLKPKKVVKLKEEKKDQDLKKAKIYELQEEKNIDANENYSNHLKQDDDEGNSPQI